MATDHTRPTGDTRAPSPELVLERANEAFWPSAANDLPSAQAGDVPDARGHGRDGERRRGVLCWDPFPVETMRAPSDSTGNYSVALANAAMGYASVPCHPGTKVPMVKWKPFQTELPSADLLRAWFLGTRANIAIITSGLVVFDCDDPDQAALVLAECGDTPHRLRTPSGGVHLGYRRRRGVPLSNRVKVKGLPIDIRTDGGLELIAPSATPAGRYEWLGAGLIPKSDLPVAKVGWTRERTRTRTRRTLSEFGELPFGQGSIRFPERYCLKIRSVQGENGSRGLVRVVCVLRDAGRTTQQIFDFVKGVWGPACAVPEWSDREIEHCIRRHCQG